MRDVNYGWLMRYIHMNGASMFFIVVYIHIFRGLYYGSYKAPRELLWLLGVRHLCADDGDGLHGLCAALGPDELLGRHRHHQPVLGHPGGRRERRDLALGRLRRRQPDAEPLLLAALSAAVRHRRRGDAAHHRAAPLRLEQSAGHRHEGAAGQHPLPSLLHGEGQLRPRRVPDLLRLHRVLLRRTSSASRTTTSRPIRWRRRRRSCRNGTSCPSTRSCARSRTSSPASSPCSAPSSCWRWCPGSTARRSRARASARSIAISSGCCWSTASCWASAAPIRRKAGTSSPRGSATLYYYLHFLVIFPLLGLFERPLPAAAQHQRARAEGGAISGAAHLPAPCRWRKPDAPPASRLADGGADRHRRHAIGASGIALAAEAPALPELHWSFQGIFGTFDRAALARGFQVYKEICSACHSMNLLHYRNLRATSASPRIEVKAIAASVQVTDGPNDAGDMFERPGRPSDHLQAALPEREGRPRRQ